MTTEQFQKLEALGMAAYVALVKAEELEAEASRLAGAQSAAFRDARQARREFEAAKDAVTCFLINAPRNSLDALRNPLSKA